MFIFQIKWNVSKATSQLFGRAAKQKAGAANVNPNNPVVVPVNSAAASVHPTASVRIMCGSGSRSRSGGGGISQNCAYVCVYWYALTLLYIQIQATFGDQNISMRDKLMKLYLPYQLTKRRKPENNMILYALRKCSVTPVTLVTLMINHNQLFP